MLVVTCHQLPGRIGTVESQPAGKHRLFLWIIRQDVGLAVIHNLQEVLDGALEEVTF